MDLEKKSRLTRIIVIKLPANLLKLKNYIKTSTKELKPSISAAFQSDFNFLPKSSFLKTISINHCPVFSLLSVIRGIPLALKRLVVFA